MYPAWNPALFLKILRPHRFYFACNSGNMYSSQLQIAMRGYPSGRQISQYYSLPSGMFPGRFPLPDFHFRKVPGYRERHHGNTSGRSFRFLISPFLLLVFFIILLHLSGFLMVRSGRSWCHPYPEYNHLYPDMTLPAVST